MQSGQEMGRQKWKKEHRSRQHAEYNIGAQTHLLSTKQKVTTRSPLLMVHWQSLQPTVWRFFWTPITRRGTSTLPKFRHFFNSSRPHYSSEYSPYGHFILETLHKHRYPKAPETQTSSLCSQKTRRSTSRPGNQEISTSEKYQAEISPANAARALDIHVLTFTTVLLPFVTQLSR